MSHSMYTVCTCIYTVYSILNVWCYYHTQLLSYTNLTFSNPTHYNNTTTSNTSDVVKTRMQGRDAHLYKSTADCFVKVFREEGVVSF